MVHGTGELRFRPGVLVELMKLGKQFAATSTKLSERLASTIDSWPQDPTRPSEVVEVFAAIVQPIMYGELQPPGY